MSEPSKGDDNGEPIVCRVTTWYYRRMGMMAGMCLAFGLYFVYDWKVGYPKANEIADKQEWFEKVLLPSYDDALKAGKLEDWMKKAEAEGWPKGKAGEPPKWLQYAAANGWPEKPKRFTQKEVDEQLWWGLGTMGIGLIAGVMLLMNRGKVLRGESDYWVTPEGEKVLFAEVVRVDKRKWDNKGLAYAWYRTEPGGRERRAVIDDLKFAGADKVLGRMLGAFQGELIEKVAEEGEETLEGVGESESK